MSKQSKKRPKPCERWGVFDPNGNFVMDVHYEESAKACAGETGGWSYHRVRIVPVVAKAKNQKEEPMVTKKNPELDTVRRWWGIYCLSTNRLVATHLHDSKRSAGSQVQG